MTTSQTLPQRCPDIEAIVTSARALALYVVSLEESGIHSWPRGTPVEVALNLFYPYPPIIPVVNASTDNQGVPHLRFKLGHALLARAWELFYGPSGDKLCRWMLSPALFPAIWTSAVGQPELAAALQVETPGYAAWSHTAVLKGEIPCLDADLAYLEAAEGEGSNWAPPSESPELSTMIHQAQPNDHPTLLPEVTPDDILLEFLAASTSSRLSMSRAMSTLYTSGLITSPSMVKYLQLISGGIFSLSDDDVILHFELVQHFLNNNKVGEVVKWVESFVSSFMPAFY